MSSNRWKVKTDKVGQTWVKKWNNHTMMRALMLSMERQISTFILLLWLQQYLNEVFWFRCCSVGNKVLCDQLIKERIKSFESPVKSPFHPRDEIDPFPRWEQISHRKPSNQHLECVQHILRNWKLRFTAINQYIVLPVVSKLIR